MREEKNIICFADECMKRRISYINPQFRRDISGVIECEKEVDSFFCALGINEEAIGRYARVFRQRLRVLGEYWHQCNEAPHFKLLKHTDGPLYRFEIKGKELNLRVIFAFITIEQCEHAILLHAFHEKSDSSRTNYKNAIPVATKRLRELLRE